MSSLCIENSLVVSGRFVVGLWSRRYLTTWLVKLQPYSLALRAVCDYRVPPQIIVEQHPTPHHSRTIPPFDVATVKHLE
jgi:hypothetical protein